MPAEWRNQVAVVTGGSRGIGLAVCRHLAHDGECVHAVGRMNVLMLRRPTPPANVDKASPNAQNALGIDDDAVLRGL